MKLKKFFRRDCRGSFFISLISVIRFCYFKVFFDKAIIALPRAKVLGIKNIQTSGLLKIGSIDTGFADNRNRTFFNIKGKLILSEGFTFGSGCNVYVGSKGMFRIGRGGYVNINTDFIIMHSLTIGDDCVIPWNCQFLDEDFHKIDYSGRKDKEELGISVGNHVWFGCGVKIFKGSIIPSGCVIAADSVVRGIFTEENCLIAGNPARVIKQNVIWK